MACPYNLDQVKLNPTFTPINEYWQKDVQCYKISSKIYLKKNPQHVRFF